MIRKVDNKYRVESQSGKNLGEYDTREEAEHRLQQVEYFKHKDDNDLRVAQILMNLYVLGEFDLADKVLCAIAIANDNVKEPKPDVTYSSLMRTLRKGDNDKRLTFQKTFKQSFENALDEELDDPERVALMAGLKAINAE